MAETLPSSVAPELEVPTTVEAKAARLAEIERKYSHLIDILKDLCRYKDGELTGYDQSDIVNSLRLHSLMPESTLRNLEEAIAAGVVFSANSMLGIIAGRIQELSDEFNSIYLS